MERELKLEKGDWCHIVEGLECWVKDCAYSYKQWGAIEGCAGEVTRAELL